MMKYALMVALLCVLVTGCEKSPTEQMKDKAEAAKDKVNETAHNVFSGTVKAIDKAKGVGNTLMDQAAEQRRKIEDDSK